jgi:hypothetical protein
MHSPDGIVHFDSSTVSDFKKEYAIWTPYPLAKSKTGPYRSPPVHHPLKPLGFLSDGFVSGINSQTIKTVLSATPAMPTNPIAPPKFPTTRLKSVVLSDAPMPAKVPTKPWASTRYQA